MRIVIVGGSQFGIVTAEKLIGRGFEVVLIDRSREKLDRLAERLDCGLIEGDGTLPHTLRDAFGSDSDILIALTNRSDDNILASLVGRSVGYGRVILQIVDAELMAVCEELGLHEVLTPHATVADSIVASVVDGGETEPVVKLHNELRLVSHCVTRALSGRTVAELELPRGARPIARVRDGKESFAEASTRLGEGDFLLFAVEADEAEALAERFEEKAEA
ncbi:MAG: NAD-binding protein [Paracoccaceae bacterium]|nr:NAD-binding protein [Paracoccaceae bacterium]